MKRIIAFFSDRRGLALIEFAMTLPIILTLGLAGAETTNYVITRMRISQIALHLADNAARIGEGTQLQQKTIDERDIDDLLTGAGMQAGELDLYGRGRVKISSVEVDPANTGRYRIRWQRCRGNRAYISPYDRNKTNLKGVGPQDRQVIALPDGATMWVEVAYDYQPLVRSDLVPSIEMIELASMMVRDRRALNLSEDIDKDQDGIEEVAGVEESSCEVQPG